MKASECQPAAPEVRPHWFCSLIGTPLLLLGGIVSAAITIFLFAYLASRVGGERPHPGFIGIAFVWLLFGVVPIAVGASLLQVAPSTKRFWVGLLLLILVLFVVVTVDGNFGPRDWRRPFNFEKSLVTDAASLKHTIVSAHTDAPVSPGTNVLWCGTFQLAWDEACRVARGDLHFAQDPPIVLALNKHLFSKNSLDDPSCVAMAGFVKDGIFEKIRGAVTAKFKGAFKPRFIPDKSIAKTPYDLIAYACLYKNLRFSTPFERLERDLNFGGATVPAFGFTIGKPLKSEMCAQVLILDYQSEDDFTIELKTKSAGDRLILAKVKPGATLGGTIANVKTRATTNSTEIATTNDVLAVPRIKFDISRSYSELIHLPLKIAGMGSDTYISSAMQNTMFEMNEKGVELQSEAHMSIACSAQEISVPKHKMIFDKPFLVMMERADARSPYFALWVGNPELLVSNN